MGIKNGMRKSKCGAMAWIKPESLHDDAVTAASYAKYLAPP